MATAPAAARMTVAAELVDGDTAPWTASEDFGAFAREVPGCFALLGTGTAATPLHSADFAFNDEVLGTGVDYHLNAQAAAAAKEFFAHGVDAGPCGAASLAALPAARKFVSAATVVLLVTEGSAANPH